MANWASVLNLRKFVFSSEKELQKHVALYSESYWTDYLLN